MKKRNFLLDLDLQHFAEPAAAPATPGEPGAAATPPAAPPAAPATPADPPPAPAATGDTSAASGGADPAKPKAPEGGQTEPAKPAGMTEAELKTYAEGQVLKELGVDSIDALKQRLAAAGKPSDPPPADPANAKVEPDAKDAEIGSLKAQLAGLKAGVNADSLEDVIALAERQVGDDLDINGAIAKVLEKYPQFGGAAQPAKPASPKPRFGDPGSGRQTDDSDPFVKALLGK